MKLHFYCGMNVWKGDTIWDEPGECYGEVDIEIDRDIFEAEGASVVCPKCRATLDHKHHSEITDAEDHYD